MDQERSASSRKSLNSEIGGEVEVVYFKLKVLKGQKAPWFCCPFYICERLYLPSCPFMEHLLAEKAAGAWPEEPWVLTGSEAFFERFEIDRHQCAHHPGRADPVQPEEERLRNLSQYSGNAVTDPQPSANNTGQQTPTGSPPGDAGSARAAARPTGSADEAGSAPEADQGQQVGRAASYHTSTDQGQGGRDSGLASPSAVPSPPAPAPAAAAAAASSSQDQPDVPYAPMEVSPSPYESEQRDDSGSGHTLSSSRPHQQQDQAHQVGRTASYHTSTDQGQGGRDSGLASPSAVPSPPAPAAAAAAAASSSQDQPDVPYAPMEVSSPLYEAEQRDDIGSGHTLSSSRPHQQQDQAHQVGRTASYHTSTDQGQGGRDSGLASPSAVPSPPAPAAAAAAAASSSQDQPDVPNDNKIEVLPVGSSDGATSPSMRHEK
ncbi:unnamed protein product [Vitrella brassicaformis CCMP3155]|uniref:Uncharacterized protein n=1 Tax=Vitrella brassicaformis (strain CCMP3155) TaxID=1169540 RepID=A0A0G4GD01_VITBC|nr:unnamed protein product [Vitrella brassicaformis CCMP3155]|eukprot:CEM27050.1 unnamed protein product [Vitrella brassicaformis CCMP3155]